MNESFIYVQIRFFCVTDLFKITEGNNMTENEAIMQLVSGRDGILLDSATEERLALEQVRLGNKYNYKLHLAYELAIKVLHEIQLYRTLDTY